MSIQSLFMPRSIAIYGASATDSRKLGNILLSNAANEAGEIVAVHPSTESIDGIPAVSSLDRPVDLALVSVPAPRVESAVSDAAAAGAKAGVILSSGFGETGKEGREVQDRIAATATMRSIARSHPNAAVR